MWTQQKHLQPRRWGLGVKRRAGNTNMNSCFAIKKTDDTNLTPIWKRLVITKTFFPSIWIYYLILTFELSYFQRISHKKTLPNIFCLEFLKEHMSALSTLWSLLKKSSPCRRRRSAKSIQGPKERKSSIFLENEDMWCKALRSRGGEDWHNHEEDSNLSYCW